MSSKNHSSGSALKDLRERLRISDKLADRIEADEESNGSVGRGSKPEQSNRSSIKSFLPLTVVALAAICVAGTTISLLYVKTQELNVKTQEVNSLFEELLEKAEVAKKSGDFSACIKLAQGATQSNASHSVDTAQLMELESTCRRLQVSLEKLEELVDEGSHVEVLEALQEISDIPDEQVSSIPPYKEVLKKIVDGFVQEVKGFQTDIRTDAKYLLDSPKVQPANDDLKEEVNRLKEDLKENEDYLKEAEHAYAEGDFQKVFELFRKFRWLGQALAVETPLSEGLQKIREEKIQPIVNHSKDLQQQREASSYSHSTGAEAQKPSKGTAAPISSDPSTSGGGPTNSDSGKESDSGNEEVTTKKVTTTKMTVSEGNASKTPTDNNSSN